MTKASRQDQLVYLEALRVHAEETCRLLSNRRKSEREQAVCRAFLRSSGIRFSENELVAPCQEPADVCFREARFQVREILEQGRQRGEEWRRRQTHWEKARSIAGTKEKWVSPTPMKLSELVQVIGVALEEKSKKYGINGCAVTDALVYVNMTRSRFLIRRSSTGDLSQLKAHAWRSVCVLFPPYGTVLLAHDSAPWFLRALWWKGEKDLETFGRSI